MASSSSSSSPNLVDYDVFLSFRGEDTRENFTSHLNAALYRRKINTFIDNKLIRGDEISPSLLNAIERSKISVIIFSKSYASSKWCLEELVKILDCKKMYGQIVIPVFYHIDPSDVRRQTGTFRDAFAEHEVRFRGRKEILQRWRNALTEAANLSGFDSNVIRPESELIEEVIKDILKRLNNMMSRDNKDLVGATFNIINIKFLLANGSNRVCVVGIWGMGGIGKTTIATAVFNEISSQFEASYFAHNVREELEKGGLSHLRKELLFAILDDGDLNLRHTFTRERLGRKKVLIVFDDVTHLKQINELIGDLENLGSGCRIIVTTRDKQVLRNCGLNDAAIYEVKGLQSDESLRLFKQYAFKQNHPIGEDYMELSNRVISYTKGVPLALKVLGSFLCGRRRHEWESALDKLKRSQPKDIHTVLKISYDGLDVEEKDLFLDIACFFKGWDQYVVGSFSTHIGISVLTDKALITISFNTIRMHDLLEEMGREIVQQESITKPGQRSRLWYHKDVNKVLNKNTGTDKVLGLSFDMLKMGEIHLNPHAFSKMDNLRFLIAFDSYYRDNIKVHGFEGLEFDFTELRCLYWDYYPYTSLPMKFCPENLVVLKMHNSNLKQFWTGIENLVHLKYIDLSYSKHLLKVPNLSKARNLESLILEDCTSLLEITSPSVQNLNKLVTLNLRNCKSIVSLPIGIQLSKSLRDVILSGCSDLNTAPCISCNLELLCLEGTAIKELSTSIEGPSKLVELNLRNCSSLESLPNSIGKLKSLKYLYISGCWKLDRLPEDIGNLESLEVLEANGITIREVPSSFVHLKNLHDLSFERCRGQELVCSLLPTLSGLQFLGSLNLNHCSLTELPNNLGQLSLLSNLKLAGNNFESMPTSIMNLSELQLLDIRFCNRLQALPKLPCSIEELKAEGCKLLKALSGLPISSHAYRRREFSFTNCFSLDWNAIGNILNTLFKSYRGAIEFSGLELGLGQKIMCFPGSEIPEWFNFQSTGSSVELPQGSFNHKFVGFVFCTIVGFEDYEDLYNRTGVGYDTFYRVMVVEYELSVKLEDGNKTVDKERFTVGGPKYIKSDHLLLGFYFKRHVFREFSCNTEGIIKFNTSNNLKKCGVRLLFTEEFEESKKRSRCSIIAEEEEQSKKLKSSNFFKGESTSRSELHLVPHEKEVVEEFNPSENESSSFTLLDLNEFPHDLDGSTMDMVATTTQCAVDNDGAEPRRSGCVYDEDEPQPKEFKFF